MPIKKIEFGNVDVVYLYDPVAFSQLWIDKIRDAKTEESKLFETISLLEDRAVLLESPKRSIRTSIEVSRLEYGDSSNTKFHERNLEALSILLKCLPQFKVKAIGINLHCSLELDKPVSPGEFITTTFINDVEDIQKKLKKPLFASSVRLFYGAMEDHYDLRIHPRNITDDVITVGLHKHKDVDIAHQDRLIEITNEMFTQTCEEHIKITRSYFEGE